MKNVHNHTVKKDCRKGIAESYLKDNQKRGQKRTTGPVFSCISVSAPQEDSVGLSMNARQRC